MFTPARRAADPPAGAARRRGAPPPCSGRGAVRRSAAACGDAAAEGGGAESEGAARGAASATAAVGCESAASAAARAAALGPLGVSFEGVVLAMVFLAGSVQTRVLHRNGSLRLESSPVTVWAGAGEEDEDSAAARLAGADEAGEAASRERAEARRRRLAAARAERVRKRKERAGRDRLEEAAAVSEEVLQQQMRIAESREAKRREEERSRAAALEEQKKRVFAEQMEAKRMLEEKRLERAERERELEELRRRQAEERREREAKESLERRATLDRLNASGPLLVGGAAPSAGTAAVGAGAPHADEECLCLEPRAVLRMRRTGAREGNPAVTVAVSPTDGGVETLDAPALAEGGMLFTLPSRDAVDGAVRRAAAAAAERASGGLVGAEHVRSLMGEGPLKDGRVDEIDLRFVGRVARVAAQLHWGAGAAATAAARFGPVLQTGGEVSEELRCPAVVWPRGGPMDARAGGERVSALVESSAEIIVRSADEARAAKLLSRASATVAACYGELLRCPDGTPYAPGLLAALFVERVGAQMDAKREHARERADAQARAGRRGSASSVLKLFEELEANVLRRTRTLAAGLLLESDAGGAAPWEAAAAGGGWLASLLGPSHALVRMASGAAGSADPASDLETVLETASERRTRLAKVKEESAPVPERVWACRNVAATLRASGALVEARRMMEKAIMLKQSVVASGAEQDGTLPCDPWFLEGEVLVSPSRWAGMPPPAATRLRGAC